MSDSVQSFSATVESDRECLASWRRYPGVESLRPMIERYLAFVYSSAYRRIGNAAQAAEVTRAVFLVLARRGRKLRKKTILAGWLFEVTAIACRKLLPKRSRWDWLKRPKRSESSPNASAGANGLALRLERLDEVSICAGSIAGELDAALDRLPPAQRNAVLLQTLLNSEWPDVAKTLHIRESRARKRVARGLKNLTRHLYKRGVTLDPDALQTGRAVEDCIVLPPEGLHQEVLTAIRKSLGQPPSFKLARQTLSVLAWRRCRQRFAIGVPAAAVLLVIAGSLAWYIDSLSGHSRLITAFLFWSARHESKTIPGLAQPARAWPSDATAPHLNTSAIHTAHDLYQTTNIWLAHLKFSREQWKALEPTRIAPLPNFLQSDGTVLLRNPKARRSGLAGVLGLDFNWTHADFDFAGKQFTNVGSRFKGNGTYLTSLYGWKRPFKVDLNKFVKGQKLGGIDELNFHNLVDDASYMSDTLAYEFFRDAGVPASRTAYAYISVSAERMWDHHPLGLYLMAEAVNGAFLAERFGSKTIPLFKPVTLELFKHLGDDWGAYGGIYDLKTKATVEQLRRLIEFAHLVSYATDSEFAERVGDFLDLDEFARFLAGETLLSSYDSLFSNGQNFYLYLDPKSNKFGFIPWDLDLAWGGFFLLGTTKERERASIWHPWVGEDRFFQRLLAVQQFRTIYRAHLEEFLARLFVPDRLYRRIDELAAIIRSPIAAESDFRLGRFEQAISDKPAEKPAKRSRGADRPVHQLKRFIKHRAISVRSQLDGESKGIILERPERR